MTRKLLVALLASAILAGCSKNDTPAPVQPSEYLVVTVYDMTAGNYKLVKYNTDGSGEAAFIANRIAETNEFAVPSVSPKGRKVAYFEGGTLKFMDVKTNAVTNVYTHPNTFVACPMFNADETKMAFSASPTGDELADLYIVNAAENATPLKITNNEEDYLAIYPRFSADGIKITFANGHFDQGGIYVSDLQGNNMVRVSEDHQLGDFDAFPVFTIDGNKVVYSSTKYATDNENFELIMSNVAEGAEGVSSRMFEAAVTGIRNSALPVASPDGVFIYFIGEDQNGAQSIYKVPVAGGTPTKIKTVVTDANSMAMNLAYVKE